MILFFVFRLNGFTSKVLGAEGAVGLEFYPTSEIRNKYIYDAFLMIYLSILLLLFLVTFWHFKGVNWRAVILKFCKIVRESQDNISKQAAVKKEPLTREKGKKG